MNHRTKFVEDGGATILLFAPPSHRPASDLVPLGDIVLAVVMRLATDRPRVLVPVQTGGGSGPA